jgi:hypothetical protein
MYVMFCKTLFVLLSFFFWPLCCLSFDLRNLITPFRITQFAGFKYCSSRDEVENILDFFKIVFYGFHLVLAFLIDTYPVSICLSVRPSVSMSVENVSHFHILSQNHCMSCHQTYHNCFCRGQSSPLILVRFVLLDL